MAKVPDCFCFGDKKIVCKKTVYPFIDVPMFGHMSWDTSGRNELHTAQLKHNFCPQCGKPYKEAQE